MPRTPGERGFTLVEVMVAVVIIGLAVTALLVSIPEALKMQKAAEMAATANNLAGESIEEYRAYFNSHDYAKLANRTAETDAPSLAARGHGGFRRSVTVSQSGAAPDRTWTLLVTVNYTMGGSEHSVANQTLFAER